MKHTKGPWIISNEFIFMQDGTAISFSTLGTNINKADQTLIAACPEMLALLKDSANQLDKYKIDEHLCDKITALIEKIEG